MKQQRKIVHVEIRDPKQGCKRHHYFGSVAAIYDKLSSDTVGVTKETLWRKLKECDEYCGKRVVVRQGILISKQTDRGIKKEDK